MDPNAYELDYPKAIVGQITFGALNLEDLLIFVITVTVCKQWGPGPTYGLGLSLITIYLYKKLTEGQPPGYLVHRASCVSREMMADPLLGPLMRSLSRIAKGVWTRAGSLPAYTIVRRYEK